MSIGLVCHCHKRYRNTRWWASKAEKLRFYTCIYLGYSIFIASIVCPLHTQRKAAFCNGFCIWKGFLSGYIPPPFLCVTIRTVSTTPLITFPVAHHKTLDFSSPNFVLLLSLHFHHIIVLLESQGHFVTHDLLGKYCKTTWRKCICDLQG